MKAGQDARLSAQLAYSRWHRSLGFSYFAMDIDTVEFRSGRPAAVVEASEVTAAYPMCDGPYGVFNRFLRETGGFQLEVAWWVAQRLGVVPYVLCVDPTTAERVVVLSLASGRVTEMSTHEFISFLVGLPDREETGRTLTLPELVESLQGRYPGTRAYPYFADQESWRRDYGRRIEEIRSGYVRNRPAPGSPPPFPVKGETTGQRPRTYDDYRRGVSSEPFITIDWVEWRRDDGAGRIGRPVAMIKTEAVSSDEAGVAAEAHRRFFQSDDKVRWDDVAAGLGVPWYFTAYAVDEVGRIGDRLSVLRHDGDVREFDRSSYGRWITTL